MKYETDSNAEQRTINVNQHTYAIARASDRKNILRTGNLRPCIAFYGIHHGHGVAFMSHIDGKICGIDAMVRTLDEMTGGDLEKFSLYFTTNYTIWLRIAVLIAAIVSPVWLQRIPGDHAIFFGGLLLLALGFLWVSMVQILWCAWFRFNTWKVIPKMKFSFLGAIEASIDASQWSQSDTSSGGQAAQARIDPLGGAASKLAYDTLKGHSWHAPMREVHPEL